MDGLSIYTHTIESFSQPHIDSLSPELFLSYLFSEELIKFSLACDTTEAQWRQQFNSVKAKLELGKQYHRAIFDYAICPTCGEIFTIKNSYIFLPNNFHCQSKSLKYNGVYHIASTTENVINLINNILKTKGSLLCYQVKNETELDYTIL